MKQTSKRKFKKVAVLMGGISAEREVSLKSGSAVAEGLRQAGYEVVEVDVVSPDFKVPAGVEAIFIALHGEFGEDGKVQKILDQKGIPYTGSGSGASAIAFNKEVSKQLILEAGIPTAEYEVLEAGAKRTLPLPVVVKPVSQGSSIGVCRVRTEAEWESAISSAFGYGDRALVEKYIPGRELTVGIVGNSTFPVVEIVAPEDWYGYDAKYSKGSTSYLVPAPLADKVAKECAGLALAVFKVLGCRSFGRVDFRLDDDGSLYVLELNTIPGFTGTSLLPKSAAAAGIGFSALCDRIISESSVFGLQSSV